MLAELATLSASIVPETHSTTISVSDEEEDEDLKHLRLRLESLRSPLNPSSSLTPVPAALDVPAISRLDSTNPPPELIPCIIALQLEHSALPWPHVQKWTKFLFSSSPATQNVPDIDVDLDRARAVAHAEAKLQTLIATELHTERALRLKKEEESLLLRRLVVSNLAAAAEKEEVERLFWEVSVAISLLPRDPLKRTRTAWVDFVSRETAVRASWVSGHVYGLVFHVRLAVAVAGGDEVSERGA
ncbi:hypothetical protein SVAN01_10462 [Stagonosporopsis vannaccii]|nr:hypothetical protein SVAN01_10462 [Stagonosporopsis vannaccii]